VVCLSVCWLQPRAALKWLNQTICRVVVDLTAESEINVPPPPKKNLLLLTVNKNFRTVTHYVG